MPSFRELEKELERLEEYHAIIHNADRLQESLAARIDLENAHVEARAKEIEKSVQHYQSLIENESDNYEQTIFSKTRLAELAEELGRLGVFRDERVAQLRSEVISAQENAGKLDMSRTEVVRQLGGLRQFPRTKDKYDKLMKEQQADLEICESAKELAATEKARIKEAHDAIESNRAEIKQQMTIAEEALSATKLELEENPKEIELVRDEMRREFLRVEDPCFGIDEKMRIEYHRVEDPRFGINASRDEHNHTFLMVAVQNNDIDTVRLCLRLGASASETCYGGRTAMFFARYFGFDEIAALLTESGGSETGDQTWNDFYSTNAKILHAIDWETQLRIAEKAAIPADTQLSATEDSSRIATAEASLGEEQKIDPPSCFDASLHDPATSRFQRIIYIERCVYDWFVEADDSSKTALVRLFRKLRNGKSVHCHRRFFVGVKREKQFEIFCAPLAQTGAATAVSNDAPVVFFSPYVGSYIEGVSKVGVLVWALSKEGESLKYKSLIESAEFRRYKVDYPNDRYPAHRDDVLELGKDMPLLDLRGTFSIFTSKAMEIMAIDVDAGDLNRIGDEFFTPQKRLLDYELQIRDAIFGSSADEAHDVEGCMHGPQRSTFIGGGAGTGKTVTMIKKVASESVHKKILVVSRLSRLVSFVKSAVGEERDTSNVTFSTYDDLLTRLTRRIKPKVASEKRDFSAFSQVQFCETTGTGAASTVSFQKDFVESFLERGERKSMEANSLRPITLWSAFRTIKSSVRCSITKAPLEKEEYMALPSSYGLNSAQRAMVYEMFSRYEEWLGSGGAKWDEADRVYYILRFGGTVFSDERYISWEERAFKFYEEGIVDQHRKPVWPFFEAICIDEAQDFSELDQALFIRMSSSVRSLFIGADPAQSVELGVRMRVGTVNRVFASCLENQNSVQVQYSWLLCLFMSGRAVPGRGAESESLPLFDWNVRKLVSMYYYCTTLTFLSVRIVVCIGKECAARDHVEDQPSHARTEPGDREMCSKNPHAVIRCPCKRRERFGTSARARGVLPSRHPSWLGLF